jgi:hypothetical protein
MHFQVQVKKLFRKTQQVVEYSNEAISQITTLAANGYLKRANNETTTTLTKVASEFFVSSFLNDDDFYNVF